MKKFLLFPFFLALCFGLLHADMPYEDGESAVVLEEEAEMPAVEVEAPGLPEWPSEQGTGFFVNHNGVIVTSARLVEGKSRVVVRVGDIDHTAEVLATNSSIGLAALKINQRTARHFGIVGFNTVTLGDRASVLGYPTVSALSDIRVESGVVSARDGINANQTYFQTSAPVRPGTDGGPIFNSRFRLIGVATSQPSDIGVLASFALAAHDVHFGIKSDFIVPAIGGNISLGRGNIKTMNDAIRATVHIRTYTRMAPTVTIVNSTGYEARRAYLRLSGERNWGGDRLGGSVLTTGQSMNVSIPAIGRYDVRLVDLDDDPYTKFGVNLVPGDTVKFVFDDIHAGGEDEEGAPEPGATLASEPGDASLPVITIANRTGQAVRAIYVSPSTSDRWGDDVLGAAALGDGESVALRLLAPLDVADRYDLRITTEDGEDKTKMRTALRSNQVIEFTADAGAAEGEGGGEVWAVLSTEPGDNALPTVTITNSTGYLIHYLYVSPSSAGGWGNDVLGAQVLERGESVTVRLLNSLDSIDEYDFRLTDSDGDDYRKMRIKLSPDQTVEFVFDDISN